MSIYDSIFYMYVFYSAIVDESKFLLPFKLIAFDSPSKICLTIQFNTFDVSIHLSEYFLGKYIYNNTQRLLIHNLWKSRLILLALPL